MSKKKPQAKKVERVSSFWRSKRGVVIGLLFVALFGAIGVWQLSKSDAADTSTNINFMNRDSVNYYYNYLWKSGEGVPTGWTGSVSGCHPGTSSAAAHRAEINAINFARRLNGLTPISGAYSTDATQNLNGQKTALIMEANGALSHNPPTTWKCYTKVGASVAGKSNLALQLPSTTPLGAVKSMFDEPGSANYAVGHRRWLLNPPAVSFGFGLTKAAASIQVIGLNTSSTNNNPYYVSWPSKGYFPANLDPAGRWSFSGRAYMCFNNATVTVTHSGTGVSVGLLSRADRSYARPTIVWQMPSGFSKAGTYTVSVHNINQMSSGKCSTSSSTQLSYSYSVYFFAPY